MESKIIGLLLLVCAGIVFQYGYEDLMEGFYPPNTKLQKTIEKDIKKTLTEEANSKKAAIHHVKFVYRSKDAHDFLKNHAPEFQTSENGGLWLEVEVLDLDDIENPGFITQTSVFDIKTKNKISEFGKTYYLKDYDQNYKKPSEEQK